MSLLQNATALKICLRVEPRFWVFHWALLDRPCLRLRNLNRSRREKIWKIISSFCGANTAE
ncbi:hypothetical protein GOL38_15355 [Sinorhizobium medicae]|nr:hypothetical protein [Sinorhizobium medicae]